MWAAHRGRAAARSGCCYPGGGSMGRALLAHVGEEEGLVDSALEDGHAQLHALLDDFATLHAGLSRELNMHFIAAGHYATETFGVRALGDGLAARFGLEHVFVDVPNPV